jgi:hypothetical protein
MSDRLKAYMIELATDVGRLTEFMFDPKKAMEAAGLTTDEQAIVTSGDQARIYATLKGLPLPEPAAAPPPPQLPTVVSVIPQDGSSAQAGGQPAAQPQSAYAQQAAYPPQAAYSAQPGMTNGFMPQPQMQYSPYYVVMWPTWPPRY